MISDTTPPNFLWVITPETATPLNTFSLASNAYAGYTSRFVQLASIYSEYSIDRVDIHIRPSGYEGHTSVALATGYTVALTEDISRLPTGTATYELPSELIDPEMFGRYQPIDISLDYAKLSRKNRVREFAPTKVGTTINYEYMNYTSNPIAGVVISAYCNTTLYYCGVLVESYVRFRGYQQ